MSSVNRNQADPFLIIRACYVDICNGNIVAAGLIHIFEQWHAVKVKNRDQERKNWGQRDPDKISTILIENLYQWHTTEELEAQLFGLGKKDKIQESRRQLVSMGIISEHRNPHPKYQFDKTTFFIFHPEAVDQYLELKNAQRTTAEPEPMAEPQQPMAENRQGGTNNRYYTKNTSIDPDIEPNRENPGAGAPGEKKPPTLKTKKGKKAPGAEPDKDWQRWVDRYEEHVKARNGGIGHNWSNGSQLGPQGLKGIRAHLVNVSTKMAGKSADDCGFGAWCYILDHWDALGDDWLAGQFDLTVLLKKITDILNRLKNATNTNRGTNSANAAGGGGTSAQRVHAVANY